MAITKVYDFTAGTTIRASEVNQNFDDLFNEVNTNMIHRDGSVAFTGIPSGPASDPTTDNEFTRKAYVDLKAGGVQEHGTRGESDPNGWTLVGATVAEDTWDTWEAMNFTTDLVDGHWYMAVFLNPGFRASGGAQSVTDGRQVRVGIMKDGTAMCHAVGTQQEDDNPGIGGTVTHVWLQSGDESDVLFQAAGRHDEDGTQNHHFYNNATQGFAQLTLVDLGDGLA